MCRRPQHFQQAKEIHQTYSQAICLLHGGCVTGTPHIQQWPIFIIFFVEDTVGTARNQPDPYHLADNTGFAVVSWVATNCGCDALLSHAGTVNVVLLQSYRCHVHLTRGALLL